MISLSQIQRQHICLHFITQSSYINRIKNIPQSWKAVNHKASQIWTNLPLTLFICLPLKQIVFQAKPWKKRFMQVSCRNFWHYHSDYKNIFCHVVKKKVQVWKDMKVCWRKFYFWMWNPFKWTLLIHWTRKKLPETAGLGSLVSNDYTNVYSNGVHAISRQESLYGTVKQSQVNYACTHCTHLSS